MTQGKVLTAFLDLGKQFLAENRLEVSAVIVAAGLEDAMKWCARNGSVTLPTKADLSTVTNALIRHGIIDGAKKAMVLPT